MLVCLMRIKNEEKNIRRTFDAMPFVDHFIVADNGSTDGTIELIRQYPSTVLHTQGFNPEKDIQLTYDVALKMGADWALQMDADEEWEKRAATDLIKLTQQDLVVGWTFRKMPFIMSDEFYRIDGEWAAFTMYEMQFAWPILLFKCQPNCYFEDPRSTDQGVVKGLRGPVRASDLRVKHWLIDSEERMKHKLSFYPRILPDRDVHNEYADHEDAVFMRWRE